MDDTEYTALPQKNGKYHNAMVSLHSGVFRCRVGRKNKRRERGNNDTTFEVYMT